MKKTSCGFFIINELGEILTCRPTLTDNWDIPKGMQEDGESYIQTAIRELDEETGIDLMGRHKEIYSTIEDIGLFRYNSQKNLYLFKVYVQKSDIVTEDLVCRSMFTHKATKTKLPENDKFEWMKVEEFEDKCFDSMKPIVSIIFNLE